MRRAIVEALLADDAVTTLVAGRVYVGRGPFGGISRSETPEAFDDHGDLLPSIVVRMGPRTPDGQVGPDNGRPGRQAIDLWCYDQRDYDVIYAITRACRNTLDRRRDLRPLDEVDLNWSETRWESDGGEQLDGAMEPHRPCVRAAFVAYIRETETEEVP